MSTIVVRRSMVNAEYLHHRKFQASAARVLDVLGEGMMIADSDVSRSSIPRNPTYYGAIRFMWFVEGGESDDAAVVGIDIDPRLHRQTSLWWSLSASSKELADALIEMLRGSEVEESDPGEDDEDEDEDEEDVSFDTGDIVHIDSGEIVLVKGFEDGRWYGTKTDGYQVSFYGEDVDDMLGSAEYEIAQSFDLDIDRMDGEGGDEYNIAKYMGRLVKVEGIDGEDFSICISGSWVYLGEKEGELLADGRLTREGCYQQGDDVEVKLKSGSTISGTVTGLSENEDQAYRIELEDESDIADNDIE